MSKINQLVRKVYNFKLRKSLKNENITLISSNCVGACILNDLGVRFNSPFVNLWIKPKDFLKICENLSYYMKQSLTFIQIKGIDYPVALLGDVSIYFQHYKSEKEAEECWNRRVKRMNLNHIYIYICFTDRDGCTYEDLKRFDSLPYKNKIAFCHKDYPELKSTHYIKGFETEESVGQLMEFENKFTYKRRYDDFDFIKWFNK